MDNRKRVLDNLNEVHETNKKKKANKKDKMHDQNKLEGSFCVMVRLIYLNGLVLMKLLGNCQIKCTK